MSKCGTGSDRSYASDCTQILKSLYRGVPEDQFVSQALCSALPVAYNSSPREEWAPFASLVLEASYEATLLAGVLNYRLTGNPRVYVTMVGGGAFGNELAG